MSLLRPSTFDLRTGNPAHDRSSAYQLGDTLGPQGLDLGHLRAGVRAAELLPLRPGHLDDRSPLGMTLKQLQAELGDGLAVYRLPTDLCSEAITMTPSRFEQLRVWRRGANGISRYRDRMTGEQYFLKHLREESSLYEIGSSIVARQMGFPQGLVRHASLPGERHTAVLVQHIRDLYQPGTPIEPLRDKTDLWKASGTSQVAMHVLDAVIDNHDRHLNNVMLVGARPHGVAHVIDHDHVEANSGFNPDEIDTYLRGAVAHFEVLIYLPANEVRTIIEQASEAIASTPWSVWIPKLIAADGLDATRERSLRAFAVGAHQRAVVIGNNAERLSHALLDMPDPENFKANFDSWF